ncbi:hypothetical protein [Brachybacterium hainanense]|uniref:Tetratricopeptide repeat protein n=1 Tax=Brachybacterium hainanense TaxID=1541174 RepID=A0ABV6RJJ2_9MICO
MTHIDAPGSRIRIDEDTLREVAEDPDALSAWCDAHPEDPRTVAFLRIVGRLDEAAAAGRRALEQAGVQPLVRAVRRARYAHVLQWQGAFVAADEQFDIAAEESGLGDPTSPSSLLVLASVFQHRAKNRFEHAAHLRARDRPLAAHRTLAAACEDARRALSLRESLSPEDAELIASSRQTLARISRSG